MQIYTTMSVLRLALAEVGSVIFLSTFEHSSHCRFQQAKQCQQDARATLLTRHVEKVDHRDDKHPDEVHEVPVQRPDLDIVRVVATSFVAERHDGEGDH